MRKINYVLLIDDEEIDQRQYQRVLKNSGIVEIIKIFTYADEALEFLIANPAIKVDVIFLDINMPRMNGFEFLEAATKSLGVGFAKVIVAMLTTSLNPKDEKRAMQFAAVRQFINKPLTTKHIVEVAELLEAA